jgi:hypothetical protein
VARLLAWVHPVWMLASVLLAALALRSGLALRRTRISGAPRRPEQRRRHLRLAKPALVLVLLGFGLGLVSSAWLRGWQPLASFHGLLALAVLALFGAAAALGRRLEHGRSRAFDVHALLGGLAVLLAALAAVAGFSLLP